MLRNQVIIELMMLVIDVIMQDILIKMVILETSRHELEVSV